MRASVIIVTYNHARDVQRCLAALLPTLGDQDELIVVDNASLDASADVARRHGVRVERLQRNIGFGAACNHAARQSEADMLVFLNPDTMPLPGWLDGLLDGLRHADLVTAKLLHLSDPSRIDAFGNDLHISGIPTCRAWGEPSTSRTSVEDVAAVSGACFAIRRSLFEQLGGFDERLFLYYEDDDLSLRARLAGFRCIAVPHAIVLHDHRPGLSPAKLRYLERNRVWCLLKLYRWRTLASLLPVLLSAEVIAWGLAGALGPRHVLAKARAWMEVLLLLRVLACERGRVRRLVPDRDLIRLHGSWLPFRQVAAGPGAQLVERCVHVGFSAGRAFALRWGLN
jgi:GT2 family glycosyltransferase